jgi:regulator of protease activity HflC (stomatin/prohibitin superfamily)
MRRTIIVFTALLFALAGMAGGAIAMQPPGGEQAQERFGCVDGTDDAVAGHPGAAGLLGATPMVGGLTAKTPASEVRSTAWSAVDRADPIELGSC